MSDFINYSNGNWQESTKSTVSLYDGGFLLGDGLFETIRFQNRMVFQCNKHLDRLLAGLNLIRINIHKSKTDFKNLLDKIIHKNSLNNGLLRLMITRGIVEGAPWQYEGPAAIYITIRPLTNRPKLPVKVIFYPEKKYPIIRFNPAIKSLNYIGNMLAKKDADKEGAYEPVFYNNDKFITECAIRNIFFINNNTLLTPSIKLGVLPGVMRDSIILISKKMDLEVKETNIHLESINDTDEAFISSTGIGLFPCYWEGWKSNYTITSKLKLKLDKLIMSSK